MGYEKNDIGIGICDFGYCDEGEDGVLGATLQRGVPASPLHVTATVSVSVRPADVRPAHPTTIQMFIHRGGFWMVGRGSQKALVRPRPGSYVSEYPAEMLGVAEFSSIPIGSEVKFRISGTCNGVTYSRTTEPYTVLNRSWSIMMPGVSCPLTPRDVSSLQRR